LERRLLLRPRLPARPHKAAAPKLVDRSPVPVNTKITEYILSDEALMTLSQRADIIKNFPFMQVVKPQNVKACCNKSAEIRKANKQILDTLKQTLLSMDAGKKELLHRLLKVSQITIYKSSPRGIQKHVI